jgi:hypothetical protein
MDTCVREEHVKAWAKFSSVQWRTSLSTVINLEIP